jgi:hypothetical protein
MHDGSECQACKDLPVELYGLRVQLATEAIDQDGWPDDYLSRLFAMEVAHWYNSDNEYSVSEAEDTQDKIQEQTEPGPTSSQQTEPFPLPMKSTKGKGVGKSSSKKRHSSGDSNASSQSISNKRRASLEAKKKKEQAEMEWKTNVDETLKKITEAMMIFNNNMAQQAGNTPPVAQPQAHVPQVNVPLQPQQPQLQPMAPPVQTQTQHTIVMGSAQPKGGVPVGQSFHQEPPRQPQNSSKPSNTQSVHGDRELVTVDLTLEDLGESAEGSLHDSHLDSDNDIDLGRLEKRRMYVIGMKDFLPDLKYQENEVQPASSCFTFNTPKPKEGKMPFLSEVFDHAAEAARYKERKPKDPFKNLKKYYDTTEPAESSLLSPRVIPRELIQFMLPDSQNAVGTSGRKAVLKKGTVESMKEEMADRSYNQASGYLRLSNNLELDGCIAGQLMERIDKQVSELLKVPGLPPQARLNALEINRASRLMGKTIFDVKSCNSDFLKCAISHYQSALHDKRDAWLHASNMPKGTFLELKECDFDIPSAAAKPGPLSLWHDQGQAILKESYETFIVNRNRGQVQSWQRQNAGHGQARYNQPYSNTQGHPYGQGQGQGRGRGRGSSKKPNNAGQGQGRGRGGRGRGGRGGHQPQPFSQGQKFQSNK